MATETELADRGLPLEERLTLLKGVATFGRLPDGALGELASLLLPGRLDLDDLVLLDALSILGDFENHDAFAADNVLGSPAYLGIYLAIDGGGPLVGVYLRARYSSLRNIRCAIANSSPTAAT